MISKSFVTNISRELCKVLSSKSIVFLLIFLTVMLPLATALSISDVSIQGQHQVNGLLEDSDFALFSVEVSDPIEAPSLTVDVFDKQYFFEVSETDLIKGKKITFYTIEFPKPSSTKDLMEINNLNVYSQKYHNALVPEIE